MIEKFSFSRQCLKNNSKALTQQAVQSIQLMLLLMYSPQNIVSNDFQHNLTPSHCWHQLLLRYNQQREYPHIRSPPCCIPRIFFEMYYLTLVSISFLFRINNLLFSKAFEVDYNEIIFISLYVVCRDSEKTRKISLTEKRSLH